MEGQARLNSLSQGLEALGWIQDRNLHIDARWPGDDLDRLRAEVADFVNVILAGPPTRFCQCNAKRKPFPLFS